MKIGISVFQQRISPRLDQCREVRVYEIGKKAKPPINSQHSIFWKNESITERAQALQDQGVVGLVCGAAEPWMEELFQTRGIRLFPWVSGRLDQILESLTRSGPDSLQSVGRP